MKKNILSFLCLFIISFVFAQTKVINIWYTPVQKPAYVWDEYYYYFAPQYLAEDLAGLLESSTGLTFVPKVYDGKSKTGILLLLDSANHKLSNEAAIVNSDGVSFLKITGRYASGLSYALYTYLEKVGFKFYLPGKKWTIIPAKKNIFLGKINNETWKPFFKVRASFLSGGMHWIKNLDPQANNLKEWNTWFRRNRMGSEYMILGGHIGEAFNAYNRKEIEKDSMILAPINGKRKYDVYGKLDPTYEKGVNLFNNWIVEQYKDAKKIVPSFIPCNTYQSVDPGDGLNYCHSPECKEKFKSVSDQVFTVANKAAIKFKNLYPTAGVNLYAYSERADTPSVKLESNIQVCVVATAFQDVATPEGLIKRWAKKAKHISLYDYLNIGVWNIDQPFFNLKKYFHFLDFVKQQKVEGFNFESGGSAMSSGIVQYLVLKYLCNPYADVQKEFDKFCDDVFGNAAPPLKKMMHEWFFSADKIGTRYEQVTFNEAELGRFVNYIQEASNTEGLTKIQEERIFQLKAYVVYLAKIYELKADVGGLYANRFDPSYKKNKVEEILNYTWMLYPTLIFHNTQINDIFKIEMANETFSKKWDWVYSDTYKDITIDAEKKVNEEFIKTYRKYSQQAHEIYTDIDGLLTKAYLYKANSIKICMKDASSFVNYRYALNVFCAAPTQITIQYKAKPEKALESKMNDIGFITMFNDNCSFFSEQFIYPNKLNGSIVFTLPTKGHYYIHFAQHNVVNYDYSIAPGKTLFYMNNTVIQTTGLQVMDNVDGNVNTNKQLAFYTGNADSIIYNMIYADKAHYTHIYNYKGEKKILTDIFPPYRLAFKLKEDEKNTFMYFTTDVFTWPPEFKTTPPYFFFLDFPLKVKK
jgi:hypothetical protein